MTTFFKTNDGTVLAVFAYLNNSAGCCVEWDDELVQHLESDGCGTYYEDSHVFEQNEYNWRSYVLLSYGDMCVSINDAARYADLGDDVMYVWVEVYDITGIVDDYNYLSDIDEDVIKSCRREWRCSLCEVWER